VDWLEFQVSDTGVGMTPEQVKGLFQPFMQVDVETARRHGGTGLGLALVKRFCHLLGGTVQVQSTAGQGSTFTVTLPRDLPKGHADVPIVQKQERRRPAPTGATAPTRPVVLVIDDDSAARDLLEASLRREGFDVVTAASGGEGLRVLQRLRPAAVTLDVLMPQPDGWAVLSTIKSDPATADIPVVMATVVDQQNLGFALGADEYLTKPIDRERLRNVMRRFCAQTQRRRALIVEDDPMTRDWLRRALEHEGWEVIEAANGRPAIELVAANQPDLILLDLLMPEMDGFEFLTALRQLPLGTRVPVIVITAKDIGDEDRQRLNGHVDRILKKGGLSPSQLVSEVRAVLRSGQEPPASS